MLHKDNAHTYTRDYAESRDQEDPLRHLRSEFLIPTKADLTRKTLHATSTEHNSEECTYLCGNSLGLQPRRARQRIDNFLSQWSTKGVYGHFVEHDDSPLAPFLHIDDTAAKLTAPLVGAETSEVAVMGTLTGNLHLLMGSFYRPTNERYKIILEGKAFPSDHYVVESQIIHHNFSPKTAMILAEPPSSSRPILSTSAILDLISTHATSTALILLPAVQFYTGQYFDIARITAHAHSHGIPIGWDCAHAVGNVDLKLHDWNVDFAAWCTYKYLNSGPGAIAGLFVHEKHGKVDMNNTHEPFTPRLSGWWGADKDTRFQMTNEFVPRQGAAGFQLSNPSALDLAANTASLEIFHMTSMAALRQKSTALTTYLEILLLHYPAEQDDRPFEIISPSNPEERGAQLSIRLKHGLLDEVLKYLQEHGVVTDERKPDVIRVAPAPLYNSYVDVWVFVEVFFEGIKEAMAKGNIK